MAEAPGLESVSEPPAKASIRVSERERVSTGPGLVLASCTSVDLA